MRYRAIGFDMDGTIVDSEIDYAKLALVEHDIFMKLGVPDELLTKGSEKEIILAGIEYLKKQGKTYTFEEISEMVTEKDNEIESENVEKSVLFPGTEKLLKRIKSENILLGLLTRGQRGYVTKTLKFCEIENCFDAIEAYDDHPIGEQKPNPIAMEHLARKLGVKPQEILYIGDSTTDYACAAGSGADFIGMAFDEKHIEMWKKLDENIKIAESMEELEKMIFG